jgi:heavy metal sensor kinase
VPIRIRITIWYVALLAVIVAAVGAFVVVRLRGDLTESVDNRLRAAAHEIAIVYGPEGPVELKDTSRTALSGERAVSQALTPDGRVVVFFGDRTGSKPLLGAPQRAAALRGERVKQTVGSGPGFRVTAEPAMRKGEQQLVVVAESLAPVDDSVHKVLVLLLLALPGALLLTAAGGWWLARRALQPIDRMTTTAEGIEVGHLDARLAEPGTRDEVDHLARTLNTMLDRIRSGVEQQRQLVADASHELRTPLAAMRSELDVSLRTDDLSAAAREVLESAREEVDRLSRTVDDLLTLAQADENGLTTAADPVDLQGVIAEAGAAIEPVAEHRGVNVQVNGSPALVTGDRERLRHAVANLVDNAVKFSPREGSVRVSSSVNGEHARVTVSDEGPGIAPENRERIFERFFRADSSRTRSAGGSGLGLAIAHEIVTAHGGRLWVEERVPHGSVFHIELPLAAPRATT